MSRDIQTIDDRGLVRAASGGGGFNADKSYTKLTLPVSTGKITAGFISADGTAMALFYENTNGYFYCERWATPWDPSTKTTHTSILKSSWWKALVISPDGLKIIGTNDGRRVRSAILSTAYDVSTMGTESESPSTSGVDRGYVTKDGLYMFGYDAGADEIRRYDMSTAFDASSLNATPAQTVSWTGGGSGEIRGSHLPNGLLHFETGGDHRTISLNNGMPDMSGGVTINELFLPPSSSGVECLHVSEDGRYELLCGNDSALYLGFRDHQAQAV